MTIKGNTLRDLKDYFYEKLRDFFPEREINQLFYILLNDFLTISKTDYLLNPERRISESEIVKFVHAIKDLQKQKPVSYITGRHLFYNLPLFVNEHVLIPRPETEELVDFCINELNNIEYPLVLDLCTGSGSIALALKKHLNNATVTATDVSEEALTVAKKNAENLSLSIQFITDDILNSQLAISPNSVDLIVSNPPYIPEKDKDKMAENVLNYEPHIALFTKNSETLIFYDIISDKAKNWLKPNGLLAMEIHEDYAENVVHLLEKRNFKSITIHNDLNGKNRFVSCRK